MKTIQELLNQANERLKTLTYESYERFASDQIRKDKTLIYNDEEMEETIVESNI